MEEQKRLVGRELAKRVKSGEVIGVGTGSTVNIAIEEIGKRIQAEKLGLSVVTTSYQSAWRCEEIGLQVLHAQYSGDISWSFDGADEVDPKLRLLKGRGGALLREKILAARSQKLVIIVDESKLVDKLGEKFAVPVECIPEARFVAERELVTLGASDVTLRLDQRIGSPVLTEAGNLLLDAKFSNVTDELCLQLNSIPGVVEHGVFIGYASEVIVSSADGIRTLASQGNE